MAYEKGSGCSFFDLSSTFLKPYDNLELSLIFSKPYINLERFFTKPYDNLEPHNNYKAISPLCKGLQCIFLLYKKTQRFEAVSFIHAHAEFYDK